MGKRTKTFRPSERLNAALRDRCRTLGDYERLAGIDTQSQAERAALWGLFRHLYDGPAQAVTDALVDHCATIALARVADGRLSLIARQEEA